MYLLLINPILWLPLSIGAYAVLRHYRPHMDKGTAAFIATFVTPLCLVFIARRFN